MADRVKEYSQGMFSWLKNVSHGLGLYGKGKEREVSPRTLKMGVIGLKESAFDRAVYKALVSRTSLYYEHDLNARYLQASSDEDLLEKQLITFLNSEQFDIVVPIGFIPAKGLARLSQKNKTSYQSIFTDVHEPIEHGIIDNPLTDKSIITGLEELPVDYTKFIKSLTILATRKINAALIISSLHAAHFHPYESRALQEVLNTYQIGVRKIVVTSAESLLKEIAVHIGYVDAIIVPRDKMMSPYTDMLAKVACMKRVLFCVADNETSGAAFNFGMPGEKLGVQTSDFLKPVIIKSQPLYQVRMQRPYDETMLKIRKNALYEQGSFLDRDEIEAFDLCPFKILSE
jgi:ABC-type uncharacterized transport system substrate-binding protein